MKPGVKKIICYALLTLSAVLAVLSFFISPSSINTAEIADHVSQKVGDRIHKLDTYAEALMYEPPSADSWAELDGFPDDMVLYRYVADTLHSWYNVFNLSNDDISEKSEYPRLSLPEFGITSPLCATSAEVRYVNLGSRWYLVKSRTKGRVKVVEGLLIKDSFLENAAKGRNGTNDKIHVHGRYDVDILGQIEGSPVYVDGTPVFKVTSSYETEVSTSLTADYILRWAAMALLVLSMVIFLSEHRKPGYFAVVAGLIIILTVIARVQGVRFVEYMKAFSPSLYSTNGFINSLGLPLIYHLAVFSILYCLFLCKDSILSFAGSSVARRRWTAAFLSAVTVAALAYIFISFAGIAVNTEIELELYRFHSLSWYTLLVYVIYSFLFAAVFVNLEILRCIIPATASKKTFQRTPVILAFAFIVSIILGCTAARIGFVKEQITLDDMGRSLAVDRNAEVEDILEDSDKSISSDPVIAEFASSSGNEGLLRRRLREMYFRKISEKYRISVRVVDGQDPALHDMLSQTMEGSVAISPGSHFLYQYDPIAGSHYSGMFQYAGATGFSMVFIELRPKISHGGGFAEGDLLPPFYSYAKYNSGKLSSFSGPYAYPTVESAILNGLDSGKNNFTSNGYRHFVSRISKDETIVITRRERAVPIYFVSITYLALLIFLVMLLFRPPKKEIRTSAHYFSTRMRRLIVSSLVVTLLLMAVVSVMFVYQRNERNMENIMSGRISTIQVMLDNACRGISDTEGLHSSSFTTNLQEISSITNSDISLFTPCGRLLFSNGQEYRNRMINASRINPAAFRSISFNHHRYFIGREKIGDRKIRVLYAPVMGSSGNMIAIASTPYLETDYGFMRDAVYHASSIISLFLILLFFTILITSSMTQAIFRPLLEMSRKMKGKDVDALEKIDYRGDDEISALVEAYNNMVVDLRESAARLAAAERDKAWSEMARQVAHEIKNPLTPIKLEIQRLVRLKQKNDVSWEEKFDSVSAVILEHIDILSQTANEFSTFAKLYSEEPVEMDLDKVIRDQLALFGDSGVEITYLGTPDATFLGPKPQIIRVFVNLITNAVQAVSEQENPQVIISLRRGSSTDTWDIAFDDNGSGVSEENLPRLFTPNFTTKSSGTGLGLAICRSIVDKCGGTISYSRSFTLGGACFKVSLASAKRDA